MPEESTLYRPVGQAELELIRASGFKRFPPRLPVTWHSDAMEMMNSGRPPQDGQFCMGVWERTGALKYKLNHFAWAGNDSENPGGIGNPAGPTHIVQEIRLCPGGISLKGHLPWTLTMPRETSLTSLAC
jgi:hypothetical protein